MQADASNGLKCSLCPFRALSRYKLILHLFKRHSKDDSFVSICSVKHCQYRTKSLGALKCHYRRKHSQLNFERCMNAESILESELQYDTSGDCHDRQTERELDGQIYIRNAMAKFLLKMESRHKLSKVAVNDLVASSEHFCTLLQDFLRNKCIPNEKHLEYDSECKAILESTFEDMRTVYLREKFYKQHFKLIEPKEMLMGETYISVKGTKLLQKCYGYYIPFKEQIQSLLHLPEMWEYYNNPQMEMHTSDLMEDVCHAPCIRNHTLTLQGKPFLKIALSYDDLELQNPLRSNQAHKLAVLYFSILNVPVKYRSKLGTIFLLAICKSSYVSKFGLAGLLKNFTNTINDLSSEGITMEINGTEELINGDLIYAICDYIAANALGGFKQAASFSEKCCRTCLGDSDSIKLKFNSRYFEKRTMRRYLECCSMLEEKGISKTAFNHQSSQFGINFRSPLCNINNFSVTDSLLQDPMHNFLEGIACFAVALFLKRAIRDLDLFTLEWLNEKIASFEYFNLSHKPVKIDRQDLIKNEKIRQKAVAMLTLCQILPLIIGHKFIRLEDDFYKNLIMLLQIIQLSFAPYADLNTVGELEQLTECFCIDFLQLYGNEKFRPKLHLIIHAVQEMKLYGPGHSRSALRYEAKHQFLKSKKWSQFKNLPYSIARMHQLSLSNSMVDSFGNFNKRYFNLGACVKEGREIEISNLDALEKNCFLLSFPSLNTQSIVYETWEIEKDGCVYRQGRILLLNWNDLTVPFFGEILKLYVIKGAHYALLQELETMSFVWQFNSYEVQNTERLFVYKISELKNVFPLQKYYCRPSKKYYVNNCNAHFTGGI